MRGNDIRELFLSFFEKHDHKRIRSSSLVPAGDPTLLFTNAGMNQFKDVFTGRKARPYPRATTSQKCVRAGGKHNDLENVGFTARHHTFFEMLGNFSFGDYFKERAIELAWEFLTCTMALPVDRLWITVFREDDESHDLWRSRIGVPEDRIVRLDEKDNFWAMGDTGPCGPCSEIHYDHGSSVGCGKPDCAVGCECDRFMEIWNLVFMQYERDASGHLTPLPRPSIDTGMGLERITVVSQGKVNNFESDLFTPIIKRVQNLCGLEYGIAEKTNVSLRVIADHIRALTFLIGDGVLPSNEWRGYVVRRILRRAMRHGVLLGLSEPFLHQVVESVVEQMQSAYPNLLENQARIKKIILLEEKRFISTLRIGMDLLTRYMDAHDAVGEKLLTGKEIFTLHDTYGFPPDLAAEILQDRDFTYSHQDYEQEMQTQRERARAAWKGDAEASATNVYSDLPHVQFLGYDHLEAEAKVLAIIKDGCQIEQLKQGESGEVILNQTPFYGASGGQIGDTGRFRTDSGSALVTDSTKPLSTVIVHHVTIESGRLAVGEQLTAVVDAERRNHIGRNHTATHLLHAALRRVLGDHVKQAGSAVDAERLRFDFTHYQALQPEELNQIEQELNRWIWENHEIITTVAPLETALRSGAVALFDEKYEDTVRIVTIDGVSAELCGGTHRKRTGDIGSCLIVSESSIAAGVRRIEALTGKGAFDWVTDHQRVIAELGDLVKAPVNHLSERVARLLAENRNLVRELTEAQRSLALASVSDIIAQGKAVDSLTVYTGKFSGLDATVLRDLADAIRNRIETGVIVLGSVVEDKVTLIAAVTANLVHRIQAGKIVKEVAQLVGGGGGGRPDLAQAGGRFPEKLPLALEQTSAIVIKLLK